MQWVFNRSAPAPPSRHKRFVLFVCVPLSSISVYCYLYYFQIFRSFGVSEKPLAVESSAAVDPAGPAQVSETRDASVRPSVVICLSDASVDCQQLSPGALSETQLANGTNPFDLLMKVCLYRLTLIDRLTILNWLVD